MARVVVLVALVFVLSVMAAPVAGAETVLTVGSTVMHHDGVEVVMDVAPYIKDGRTYLPLRHCAVALGVDSENVLWDGPNRRVTLIKEDRIVQAEIGSATLLVNGDAVTMDVAPELVYPGRTMLPVRWVAEALGVEVVWDGATQTIRLMPVLLDLLLRDGEPVLDSDLWIAGYTEPGALIKVRVIDAEGQMVDAGEFTYLHEGPGRAFVVHFPLPPVPVTAVVVTATDEVGNVVERRVRVDDRLVAEIPQRYYDIEDYDVGGPAGRYRNTLADLEAFLSEWAFTLSYEKGVCDCSELAAALELLLTVSGFEASIVVGPSPCDPEGGNHAWVMVYCDDAVAAVEATALAKDDEIRRRYVLAGRPLGLIYADDPCAEGYYEGYTDEYPTIYAAVRATGGIGEWDWWNALS